MKDITKLSENEIDELYFIQQNLQRLVDRKVKKVLIQFVEDALLENGLSYLKVYADIENKNGNNEVRSEGTSFNVALNSNTVETIIDFIRTGRTEDKANAQKLITIFGNYAKEKGMNSFNEAIVPLSNGVASSRFEGDSITIGSTVDAAKVIKSLRKFINYLRSNYGALCEEYDKTEENVLVSMEPYASEHNEKPRDVLIEAVAASQNEVNEDEDADELRDISNKISDLININIKKLFVCILLDVFGDGVKEIIANAKKYQEDNNIARNPFVAQGVTAEEVLQNNSVDNLYNLICFFRVDGTQNPDSTAERINKKIDKYMKSKGVKITGSIRSAIENNVRDARNDTGHGKIVSIKLAAQRVVELRRFVSIFRVLYKDLCSRYDAREAKVFDLIVDYADRHNEQLQDIFTKSNSGMISIDEIAEELSNDQLQNMTKEAVTMLVYKAVVLNNIEQRNARVVKSQKSVVLRWIMQNASITEQQKEEIKEQTEIDTIESEALRQWLYDDISLLSDQELLSIINDGNLIIDYRFLEDNSYFNALSSRVQTLMSRSDYLFLPAAFQKYVEANAGNLGTNCLEFIENNESRILILHSGSDGLDETTELAQVVLTHPDNQFVVLTMDEELASKLSESHDNVTLLTVRNAAAGNTNTKNEKTIENKTAKVEKVSKKTTVQPKQRSAEKKTLFERKTIDPYLKDEKNQISHVPDVREEVYTLDGERIYLSEELGKGGEGKIFACDNPQVVAKIYYENCNTKNRKEKVELMCANPVDCEGICWPVKALYNDRKEFVGYIMPKAQGVTFNRLVVGGKGFIKRGWTRKDMIDCLIRIMGMFDYLHRNNILVGDINSENILIESKDRVFFVDTDSYQFDKYPLQVQKPMYEDPLVNAEPGERLVYNIREERFKIAYIAYAMLMIGDTPYPFHNGDKNKYFKFTNKGAKENNKPTFTYIWSNMEWDVKNLFLRVFDNDNRYVKATDWISALEKYRNNIEDDSEQNKVIITMYKNTKDTFETDAKCSKCGGILNMTKEQYKQKVERNGEDHVLCRDCDAKRSYESRNYRYMRCPNCKRVLSVSASYLKRQEEKGFTTRCSKCDFDHGAAGFYRLPSLADIMDEME